MNSIRETGKWNLKTRAVDMTGDRFGLLVVVRRSTSDGVGRSRWLCQCDCGGTAIYRRQVLRAGQATSCGCARKAANRANASRPHAAPVSDMDTTGAATLADCWKVAA
jgi:hypothetical protein